MKFFVFKASLSNHIMQPEYITKELREFKLVKLEFVRRRNAKGIF